MKMMNIVRSAPVRVGFTLAEVLVTLSIIAIMAAVLLPALNSQIGKGDAGRVASDLTAIQTGAQAFLSDVHRYPGSLDDLTAAITVSDTDLLGQTYPAGLASKWKGPYVAKDAISASGLGSINPTFLRTTSAQNGVAYLAVTMSNIVFADFARMEELLDENVLSTTSSTSGLVRWASASSGLTYLALPIQ